MSGSAQDSNSDILFTLGRCASWEIRHIFSDTNFTGGGGRQSHLSFSEMGGTNYQILEDPAYPSLTIPYSLFYMSRTLLNF